MSTGFFFSPEFARHATPAHHPERAQRMASVESAVRESGLWERLEHQEFEAATDEQLLWCHKPVVIARIGALVEQGGGIADAGDTYVSSESDIVARLAAGAAIAAVDAVLTGRLDNAFVASRPPGHHAETARSMGFCLYNSIAIAARAAQRQHGLQRVAILDWDVHHGNGTQEIFYDDHSVLFCSIHQSRFYPGTGERHEIGRGAGAGTTRNFPLSAGSGPAEYAEAWNEIGQIIRDYDPQLILISSGFDAHERDPLGGMNLQADDFAAMTREAIRWARELCDGKLVLILEGGYDLQGLSESTVAVIKGLLGDK
jgi:acetoin utilization deacetylase AcuC-like enzyme